MRLYSDILKEYKVLSLVGMSKNAGKTTALNFLIEEATDEDLVPGITSTGRDGEGTDLVTGTEKPKVFVYEDTIVTIPVELYEIADAGIEIIRRTDYHSTFGSILLCRVLDQGYVQVAGPTSTADQQALSQEMLELGADIVLIDGAIDRRSIASPFASDAIILSTGAVLSRDLNVVVQDTMHVVDLYSLPELGTEVATESEIEFAKSLKDKTLSESTVICQNGKPVVQGCSTGLMAGTKLDRQINEDTEFVYLPGALTTNTIEHIMPEKLKMTTFVVKDPTKIFIDRMSYRRLRKKGLKIKVLKGIKVAAITVNPYSPEGYSFGKNALLEAMRKVAGDLPVIDVKKPD